MDHFDQYVEPDESPLKSALAIKACLDYLQSEASKLGIELGAHMINVAASAVVEWIDRQTAESDLTPMLSDDTAGNCVILPWRQRAK